MKTGFTSVNSLNVYLKKNEQIKLLVKLNQEVSSAPGRKLQRGVDSMSVMDIS